MNEAERTLRSWWNNYRDVQDENGFSTFSLSVQSELRKHIERAQREQLRAERTGSSVQQVRRESFVASAVSGIMTALIGGASGRGMQQNEIKALSNGIQSIVRTALYRENTSRPPKKKY